MGMPNPEETGMLTLRRYQELNAGTDRNPAEDTPDALPLPLFGLYGETGSLLALFKKKWRDADAFLHLSESITEEIGDILWYLSNIAARSSLSLEEMAIDAFPNLRDFNPAGGLAFEDVDRQLPYTNEVSRDDIIRALVTLAESTAKLLRIAADGTISSPIPRDHFKTIFRALTDTCRISGISLATAAQCNISKTQDRWPVSQSAPPLFDETYDAAEQLPRLFTVSFEEKTFNGKTFVYQSLNGVHVGDRLTDNIKDPDFYRFHDAFHWAYAAILGWSPVTRGLLKLKRKSNPDVDENEDGARASIIEEAVSVLIFHRAKEAALFQDTKSLDFGILKSVRAMTRGYEVERAPLWLWEQAILDGYSAFRHLVENRGGALVGNLHERSISFRPAPKQ